MALASQMGIPQPRLSELEGRMRNGNVSKQLELLLATAETLGLVAVLVPQGAVEHVKGAIDDYEIAQRIGRRSQFDEIYDEVAEEEAQPVPGFGI